MISLQYFNGKNLVSLLNQVNGYCSRHSNVVDVQIFQRFYDGWQALRANDFIAVIKEKHNDR